jgi:hypothetical protein
MNYDLIHYFILIRSREPEPKLQYTGSGQKFRLHNSAKDTMKAKRAKKAREE